MKLETTAGMLKAALDTVGRAIEARNTIPILGMVKFDRDSVEGTNLDLSIKVKMPTRGASGGCCIPHRPLRALLGHIAQDEVVTLSGGKSGASIKFSATTYDLPALPVDDFPEIGLGALQALPVDGDGLKKALGFVCPCISTEETRYYLNGVCLDGNQAVATDGHRLAVHPLGFDAEAFGKGIIPREAVSALLALPPAKTLAIVNAKPGHPAISVVAGGVSMRAKLIDGTFPDWRRVVPQAEPNTRRLSAERNALRRLAMRMSSICGFRAAVALCWDEGNLALIARDVNLGITARETLPVEATAGGQTSFNIGYLKTILQAFSGENITMEIGSEHSPTIWRGDGEAFMLLMSMRWQSDLIDMASALLAERRQAIELAA